MARRVFAIERIKGRRADNRNYQLEYYEKNLISILLATGVFVFLLSMVIV